jgi:uncharacterized protein
MTAAAPDGARPRSAFYEGWVSHRRLEPVGHSFRYPILIPLLDLGELPALLDQHPLWSGRRPAPAWMRPADLLGRGERPPAQVARDLVAERTGRELDGPVLVLAHPRYFGVGFNPIRVYFVCGADGQADAAVAEVTNTPAGERHAYVFARAAGEPEIRGRAAKRMRVSPFMSLDQVYECRIGPPGERLQLAIRNREAGRVVFEAFLSLRRIDFSGRLMTRALVSYPAQTAATLARIYWQAARLWAKGAVARARISSSANQSGAAAPRSPRG